MPFTPGVILAAIIATATYLITGSTSQWWMWVMCVVVAGIVDAALGIKKTKELDIPTRTVYKKD